MDENQKKLIQEQMQRIPPEVREAIEKSDWERTIFNIGHEHKMHIDDIDTLSIETILTMIGLEHPKDYPENIQKAIGLKEEELMNLVDEVNERLFSKIREALRIHYEKVATGEIMADEEKDELHYAGIEVEDNYSPRTEKKTPITMIDQRVKEPEPEPAAPKVEEVKPEPAEEKETDKSTTPIKEEIPPENLPHEKKMRIPEVKFDPYREPIE